MDQQQESGPEPEEPAPYQLNGHPVSTAGPHSPSPVAATGRSVSENGIEQRADLGDRSRQPAGTPPEAMTGSSNESGAEPTQTLADIDWETTRYLSAATQLDLRYARFVVRRIIGEPLRAVAPAAGADIVVVTRWALAALHRRAWRDAVLACLLLLVVFTSLITWSWIPIPIVTMLAIATVGYERWIRDVKIISRLMLRGRFRARDAPHSKSDRIEQRLDTVKQQQSGNLVVFRGRRAFVGSGSRVLHSRILINSGLGKKGSGGKRKNPIKFTTAELHEALESSLKEMGFTELRVGERLFVNGEHVAAEKRLLPDEFSPPVAAAPEDLLLKGCINPTPEARTYLCAEIGGWKGQLVVSLFARAVQANGSLQVEWLFNGLPPLHSTLLRIDQRYEQHTIRQLARAAVTGVTVVIPAWLASPVMYARYAIIPLVDRIQQRNIQYRIRNGYVFNYGSTRSIREGAIGYRRAHDFVVGDELTFIYLAEHTMLRALRRFLKAHNIDMKQFDKQAQTLIKKVNKYSVGKVEGENVAIGSKARIDSSKKSEPTGAK